MGTSTKKGELRPLLVVATIGLLVFHSQLADAVPGWVSKHSNTKIDDYRYQVTCNGKGPALDIARAEALTSCKSSISSYLSNEIRVKSLAIETESDASFYSEVIEDHKLTNLACIPKREEIEEQNGQLGIWILCEFDLRKTTVESKAIDAPSKPPNNLKSLVKQKQMTDIKHGSDARSAETMVINLVVVPSCSRIIIRGARPRTIGCKSNPLPLNIFAGDDEALIVKDGYITRTLTLSGQDWKNRDSVQIILEAH